MKTTYRYIFLFTKSKEDTEEILQDIFIKIWENREKLRDQIVALFGAQACGPETPASNADALQQQANRVYCELASKPPEPG